MQLESANQIAAGMQIATHTGECGRGRAGPHTRALASAGSTVILSGAKRRGWQPSAEGIGMARQLKHCGWGAVGEGLDEAETERLFGTLSTRFGIEPRRVLAPSVEDLPLRASRLAAPGSLASITTMEPYERLLHTYGKSFPETVRAFGRDYANAPDLVAYPTSGGEVAAVLDWAGEVGAAVIPFGRGSSVVGGVEPDVGKGFAATMSLDLRRQNRVLEVDRTSRAARIEAGILGPDLETALRPHGLTLRHFPQSFAYSTLGGWIATRSGGHFATLMTHIDDLVESLRVVTGAGTLETRRLPGSGAGPSPDRLLIGSEGALGVITEAWMRLQDRPRFRGGAVFGFPDILAAAAAVRAVGQAGLFPSNLRVIDNAEAGILRRQRVRGDASDPGVRIGRPSGRCLDGARG